MLDLLLFLIFFYLIATPLAAYLWPKRKLVLLVWAMPAVLVYPMLWQWPGFFSVCVGMATLLLYLRALDAHATFDKSDRLAYAAYCHWLLPHSSEIKIPDSVRQRLIRFMRGCLFVMFALGMLWLGAELELWRTYPYLDDLMMAFELGFGFVGIIEIGTVLCMTLGIQFFIVDSFHPGFVLAPSLRDFWTKWWNRPTSGVLNRGIFVPSGGRRYRVRGLMLVFFACGLMHAAPLVLAGQQKMVWFVLALGALGFFMIQAVALSLEHVLPRKLRKGLFARVYFYLVMLVSLPLYPAPGLIALGAHNRPPETATILRLTGLPTDESRVALSSGFD